ncbi:hypothetical protein PV327_003582 [Microctonus hyperodae]|uniref:Uncharacterized protein n=1 Tax=Microctonus hyperodae TaxID=165561 RepID=A0AA39G4A7_MICHY|nr:hypothetical protein PV327_003582 [Microctonus hyperodae]
MAAMVEKYYKNKTAILICLVVIITEIKNVFTEGAAENDDKIAAKLFESLATNTSSKVPCYLLSKPMDRIKSALKDLEIYNELYCTKNSHSQPGILKGAPAVHTQILEDALASTEYPNVPENINYDSQSGGQKTMYFPSTYNRWINPPNFYPNNFVYPYNDPSYQSALYFYPNRMPYMNINPVSSPSSQTPSPQAPPYIAENFDEVVTTELSTSSSSTTVLGELALRRSRKKNDRRCSKKKLSKKLGLSHKKDENDDNANFNDNDDSDSSSSELGWYYISLIQVGMTLHYTKLDDS